MKLQTIDLNPVGRPAATVIVLHGLGADGTDFLPMADQLDLSAVGPVRYVFPRAPQRAVTINGGYSMRAWYDILSADIVKREDESGLRESIAAVGELIDAEVARGVPAQRIVLAGFSQGSAVTLGAGLRYHARLAGLAGLSGYVPLAATTAAERNQANADTPVFLAHGRNDGVVPLARGTAGRDLLLSLQQPVQWHDYPMEHAVCAEEVQALQQWLCRVLASPIA
ncbi:MAG: alpha/beta hydrolase [Pseudomonadota bacterium]|nr:alpha/beta hydrolase [Pseudomonadota bacterium]